MFIPYLRRLSAYFPAQVAFLFDAMLTTMDGTTGTMTTASTSQAAPEGLEFRPPQPDSFLQHPGTPPIPFRAWLTGFKGCIHLLEFNRAPLEDTFKKMVLFQLLGAEGMHQFGNEPAAAHLEDNAHTFTAFCGALEAFFHKPVKPAWARLELHNRRQGV